VVKACDDWRDGPDRVTVAQSILPWQVQADARIILLVAEQLKIWLWAIVAAIAVSLLVGAWRTWKDGRDQ
jgi:hypothetical protein